MQKILNKITAVILIAILAGFNCITTAVYAAEIIEQNNETSEKNITFNSTLGNESSHDGYEYIADIDSTDTYLYLNIGVKSTGYLKNISINLENSNYKFNYDKVEDQRIKNITEYSVEFNQINTSETVELAIPIIPTNNDKVAQDELGKNSTVKFSATYINEDNKEKSLEKSMTVRLNWTTNAENLAGELSQNIIRYLNYDGKTMLSFLLNDALKDSKMPVGSKEIKINVPLIENLKPTKVIVTAIDTLATNGNPDGVNFNTDNYSYDNEQGILTIKVTNTPDEQGLVSWLKGVQDKFVITYIYETDTKEKAITLHTKTTTNTTLLNGNVVTAEMNQKDYEVDSKIGDIATVEVIPINTIINKGYMYTNKDKQDEQIETEFKVKYRLNVGLAEALNEITIKENGDLFGDVNATDSIYDKKVKISHDELIKVLGEDGKIDILKSDGTVIGTLNKDTLEIDVNDSNISFKTSKPQTEGEINIEVSKAIRGNLDFSKEQISTFKTLYVKAQINEEATGEIALEEPTSKATLQVSNQNLSTVIKNENVVMNITLEKNDITDNLFANPEVDLILPDEVTGIDVKSATLLYEDELISDGYAIEGNTIKLKLNGKQTKYSSQSTADGAVIRLVLDISLNNLAPSRQTNIVLSYTNDNDKLISSSEAAEAISTGSAPQTYEVPVNVVAPTGFVTTQTIDGYNGDETVTSQETEELGKLPVLSSERSANISGIIVNNLGHDAEGFIILGRIPFEGNKQVDGSSDLGSTFSTTLSKSISVEGIDSTIYYSTNGEATSDINNIDNGWVDTYSTDTKSYMIVANGVVANGTTINFNYGINIPANIDYAEVTKASYGVYYNNINAEEATEQSVVLASPVGIKTEDKANISIDITAKDAFTNETINQNDYIKEGEFIIYTIKATNTSDENIDNVKLNLSYPQGFGMLTVKDLNLPGWPLKYEILYNSPYESELGTINAGESKTYDLYLVAGSIVSEEEIERTLRASVKADKMDGESVGVFTNNLEEGYVTGLFYSTYENKNVDAGQELEYTVEVTNVNSKTKSNIITKISLPDGVEYVSSGDENGSYQGTYDSNNREVTFNIENMDAYEKKYLKVKLRVTEENHDVIETRARLTCDGMNEEFLSNAVIVYHGKENIEATLTSNIAQGELLDTDIVEYYIDVKNTGKIPARVRISNTTPDGLINNSYSIEISNGEKTEEDNFTSQYVSQVVELEAGGSARLTIVAKPIAISSNTTKEITVAPEVEILEQNSDMTKEKVNINTITHIIQGTGGTNTPGVNGTYRIVGSAWLDENKDGKKDANEKKFSNIQMTLYDTQGNIAKDANGNELNTTTNENGQYSFNNLNSGSYQIVAHIDTANYMVTAYKVGEIGEAENSDFVDATLDGMPVAATDILNITTSNLYNIDLGIKEREQFDLKLDKKVSKITVTNTQLDPKEYEYDTNFAMVSLLNTYVEYSTVLIEYTITITNEGKVAGYAKELVDYMPEGMAFSSDLNTQWYLGTDGNLYTTSLANTVIQPGETKTINLVLTRRMTGENTGTVVNTAEISESYNEYGLEDGDSTPGNRKDGEDDISTATTLIAMNTGREVASFIGITLGILTIVGLAVFLIKKYVIKRV